METFNLNLIPNGTCPVCHASQYDIGRQFRLNLFEGDSVFTLSGAETLSVYVRKPDGNMVTAAVANTSDSYVIIETTEQMTACDGMNLCELRIEEGGDRIGTLNFLMDCEKSPDTGITSQTEINNLESQVNGFVATAVADQYDSANVIFDNVPTAGHGNGYAVTSEGVLNAIPVNSDFSLSGLSDTTITTPSSGQVLSYDGSKWVNANKDYYTKSEIDTKLNYFINEKAVGVWIDNKTIYRCVFTGFNMSTSANTWAETTVSASNLSTLISGRIIDSSGQSFSCSVGWSNGKVALNMPLARSNLTTLILEYTKA